MLDDWGNSVLVDSPLSAILRFEPLPQWFFMSYVATVATPADPRRVVARWVKMLDRREVKRMSSDIQIYELRRHPVLRVASLGTS